MLGCWPRRSAPTRSSRRNSTPPFPRPYAVRWRLCPASTSWLRMGLDPARRRQPRSRRARGPARRRGRRPRRRHPRPEAARVALAAPAPRGRRHHLRHRPPRDRAGTRRVRPGPARRGPPGVGGEHGGDARTSLGVRRTRRVRRPDADLRQRHRLRLACGTSRPQDPDRAAGRRVPRGSGSPRCPQDLPDRSAHAPCRTHAPRSTPCWPTAPSPCCRSSWFGCSSAHCCARSGSWSCVRRERRSTNWPPSCRCSCDPARSSPARRARSPLAHNDARVRSLLAPRWLPYRHGLDIVSDLAAAATNQAADVAERRRAARLAGARRALARAYRRRRLLRGRRPRGQVPHEPGRPADDRLPPGGGLVVPRRPRRRSSLRTWALARARRGRRLVAPARRVLAPPRPGQ